MARVQEFFDKATYTLSYIVYDEQSKDAVILDPVLDYDGASGKIATKSVQDLVHFIKDRQLNIGMILETHAHADHLSGAQWLKKEFPRAQVAIGHRITEVQEIFKEIYNFPADFPADGSQFDRLLQDGEQVKVGTLSFEVINTPGHTPACSSYRFLEHVFTGDSLFMPDYGTGRCDFPGGSAADLYDSITKRIYTLPLETKIYTGHDYQPLGRALRFECTVGESRQHNIQLNVTTQRADFVEFRSNRDSKLDAPKLLHPSVQVNIDAGHLPLPESNGRSYLKMPIQLE